LRIILLVIVLSIFGESRAFAQNRTVAITFDDLPYASVGTVSSADARTAEAINRKILSTLRHDHTAVTGFVVESRAEELGSRAATQILKQWTRGNFDLGNHTYSHPDINDLSVEQIESEIIRGEMIIGPLMKNAGKKLEFFRFPMNHTGDTQGKHDQIAAFLRDRSYRLATCTIDNSDYLFNAAYLRMLAKHDPAIQRLRQEYLSYTSTEIDYYTGLSKMIFGYETPQVMLLHDNRLNADTIDDILRLFKQKKYRFVTLREAQSDAAYRTPETYVTKYGPMWAYRWAAVRGVKVNGRLEPEPSEWIVQSAKQQ
jgi:peptidoglycan/xylan/chitin deacetylase (PgdA/CDA1 family)